MNITLDLNQIISALAVAGVLYMATQAALFAVFKAESKAKHIENQIRLIKIEKALGIDDPDDTSFLRRSEADARFKSMKEEDARLWQAVEHHDGRIKVLESRNRTGGGSQ